jgi:hypothetical protein
LWTREALCGMLEWLEWPENGEPVLVEKVVGHVQLSNGLCAYEYIVYTTQTRAEKFL